MPSGVQKYSVIVEREGPNKAVARTRGHTLVLNAEKGRGEAGFNAAETLMSALGACLMTNLNSLAEKMHLAIDNATLEINAVRLDDPPGISELIYVLTLVSNEPTERLEQLHDLSVKWGTVTNTLTHGVQTVGTLRIERP
ncbi:MAG: OsmC family protein [Bacillota bacterium]